LFPVHYSLKSHSITKASIYALLNYVCTKNGVWASMFFREDAGGVCWQRNAKVVKTSLRAEGEVSCLRLPANLKEIVLPRSALLAMEI
jgi:hypothetical protein